MNLSFLPKVKTKSLRRVGRGHGSGRVKTAGRGTKGQNARERVSLKFAGSSLQASWIKRLPLLRGRGKNKSHKQSSEVIRLKSLNSFAAGTTITKDSLFKAGIISNLATKVKIIASGDVDKKLFISVPISAGAKQKVEKVGGQVVS